MSFKSKSKTWPFLLLLSLLLVIICFADKASAAFPLRWEANKSSQATLKIESAIGEVFYDCVDNGINAHLYEKLTDGNWRRSGAKVEDSVPIQYLWQFTKNPWNLYTEMFEKRLFSVTGEESTVDILASNFKPSSTFVTGKIYNVIARQTSSVSGAVEFFELQFWFEPATLEVPGFGPSKGFIVSSWIGANRSQSLNRTFVDGNLKKVLFFSRSGSNGSNTCVLR